MADPQKYTPAYSFTGYQTQNPTAPLPAPRVDNELAQVSVSVGQLVDALKDVRRSDGALKNAVVTPDSLSAEARVLLAGDANPRGKWAAGTVYAAKDWVSYDGASYIAVVGHTALVSFKTDLEAGKWMLLASPYSLSGDVFVEIFDGNGSTKTFTLSRSFPSIEELEVLLQNGSAGYEYMRSSGASPQVTLSAPNQITFAAAPGAGVRNIIVRTVNKLSAIPAAAATLAARDQVLAAKADFDPKYADFYGKYEIAGPTLEVFPAQYDDFSVKYADFAPKYAISQAQWPSVQKAPLWAEQDEDVPVEPGKFSAKHWALKSAAVVLGGTTVISSNDKVPDFLANKLLAGNGVSLTVNTVGIGQTMTVTNTAVPKFYTGSNAALAQNASLVVATPNVKDGDGLKRVVSVFEETVGTSATDTSTDFDLADDAQFIFRNYAPAEAVTLTGGESVGRTELRSVAAGSGNLGVVPVNADGSKALLVYHDGSTGVYAAVVTRSGSGAYSVGAATQVFSSSSDDRPVMACGFGRSGNVLVATRTSTSLPYNWTCKCVNVGVGDAITVGAQVTLRNSGYSYGTYYIRMCSVSDTEIVVATEDYNTGGGSTKYLNIGKVTRSGTSVSVGTWLNPVSAVVSEIHLGALAHLGGNVVAVPYAEGTGSWKVRLFDVSTNPVTAGGAAVDTGTSSPETGSFRVTGTIKTAADKFSLLFNVGVNTPRSLYTQTFSYSGTSTPVQVAGYAWLQDNFDSGQATLPSAQANANVMEYAPYKFAAVGLDISTSSAIKLTVILLSLSAGGVIQKDGVQQLTIASSAALYNASYPLWASLTADNYVWASMLDTSAGKAVSFEYRPFATAVLPSSWNAADVGRAIVANGGVGRIDSISGTNATLTLLASFTGTGTVTAGNWKLRDAALYGGKLNTVKAVTSVVRTTKDSSLWETFTGLSSTSTGTVYLSWSFDGGRDWVVWTGSAKRVIATNRVSVHGGVDLQWMVQNNAGSWVFPPEDSAQSALETAITYSSNQTAPSVYASLGAANFSALGFTKSMTGTVRVAFGMTSPSTYDQLTLNYTSRSAWKRADASYSIDLGREDQVTVTKTSAGTASAYASVMYVETT